MTASLRISVDVAAEAERTWRAAVDWPTQGRWMPLTRVRAISGDGTGTGAQLVAFTGLGPLSVKDTMRITRWEPPLVCDVAHTGRVIRGTGGFAITPRGEHASTMHWYEDLELPLGALGRVGWRLAGPVFRVFFRVALKRFARMVESG